MYIEKNEVLRGPMVALNRRARNRVQTFAEIKEVAEQLMAVEGTAGLSLRGIAARMGIAVSALYRYYPSRDDLLTALIIDANTALGAYLERANGQFPAEAYTERLLTIGRAYREWALEHPTRFQLIFGNPIPGYVAPADQTIPAARSAGAPLSRVLSEAIQSGFYHPTPEYTHTGSPAERYFAEVVEGGFSYSPTVLYLNLVLWSHVHGWTILELHHHFGILLGQHTDEIFNRQLIELLNRIGWPIAHP